MEKYSMINFILISTSYHLSWARPISVPVFFPDSKPSNSYQHSQQISSNYNSKFENEDKYFSNNYNNNNHRKSKQQPNAYFNRLVNNRLPNKNDEPIQAEDYDDIDETTELTPDVYNPDVYKPQVFPPSPSSSSSSQSSPSSPSQSSSSDLYSNGGGGSNGGHVNFNNVFFSSGNKFGGLGNLFGEDRHGFHKIKRKFKRRKNRPCIPYQLFNQLKSGRDVNGDPIDPKTLLPDFNLILADLNINAPNNNYNGNGHGDSSDTGVNYNNHFYDTTGGYPCAPASYGGHFQHHRPHGGPLGFFGQGGLFDFAGSGSRPPTAQGDTEEGPVRPLIDFNLNEAFNTVAMNWKPGETFGSVAMVIADFIQQVSSAPEAVRRVNREFLSLF